MTLQYGLRLAMGEIPGVSTVHKFGHNSDIDDGFEDIWGGGDAYTGFNATAAETVEVFSGDAEDDAATGTGAHTVKIIGLDANWRTQTEIITLNGATAVDSVNTYIRCTRAMVLTAGSGGENAGEITIRQKTTTANIFAKLPLGYNQTMIACDTVPSGKIGYVRRWFFALAGRTNADSVGKLLVRPVGSVFQTKEKLSLQGNGTTFIESVHDIPKGPYAAKTDIKISADSDSANTGISAGFCMILVDE